MRSLEKRLSQNLLNQVNRKVAVVIVNWNGEAFLERCLWALSAQTVEPHEIILVDNASSDASLAIVERFPSVRVLRQTQNLGFARANNLAVAASAVDSEWIVLLNPDAVPEPAWLEALLSAASAHSSYAIFGSKLLDAAEPTVLDGAGDVYHPSGLVWRSGHGKNSDLYAESKEIFSACAAAAMYRKDAFLQAGGFDEDFFCYVEDVDLGFRLRLLGHRCWFVSESVVYHVGSGVTGRRSDFSVYHGHRNLVWTFIKDMPTALFWLFLPFHLALNVGTVIYFVLRGQGRVILRAKMDAIRGIPGMWRKRAGIQAARVATAHEIWRLLEKRIIPKS